MRAEVQYQNGKAFVIIDEAKLGLSGVGGGGNTIIVGGGSGGGAAVEKVIASTGITDLVFDNNFYGSVAQTGDMTLRVSSGNIESVEGTIIIDGNGVNNLAFLPLGRWINGTGNIFDNSKRNHIYMQFNKNEVVYSIVKSAIPTPGVSSLINAQTSQSGAAILLYYDRPLDPASVPVYTPSGGKTVGAVTIVDRIVTIPVTPSYAIGDIVTLSGGTLYDLLGNATAIFTNQPVVNSMALFTNTKSLGITNANQKVSVVNIPEMYIADAFEDKSISYAFDLKINTISGYQVLMGIDATYIRLNSIGSLEFTASNGGAYVLASQSTAISAGVWVRIVATFDGTNHAMKIYMNGTAVTITIDDSTGYIKSAASTPASPLYILAFINEGLPALGCNIDNVLVINKKLSAGEVTEDYNVGVAKNPATLSFVNNIVGDYRFEDNLLDSSGNGYNLSGTNPPVFSTSHK